MIPPINVVDVNLPDPRPGLYYVTATEFHSNAGHHGPMFYMLGPFVNDHAAALAQVEVVRQFAEAEDRRAVWMAFGTCRVAVMPLYTPEGGSWLPVGRLNYHMKGWRK